MAYRKKLIEVALPLDAINKASAREKSIRHGHPSTLHLWWARRPLAACRAVIFASLIDDPSEHPDLFPTEQEQEQERERLFKLIANMVEWEQANNEDVIKQVRAEIDKATNGNPPPVLDPFAGGGSIPLEAQRLGLAAHASDLNPVAVLINKALIEIPPKFANRPPVNPEAQQSLMDGHWQGAKGLAEDIRYYGKWMRDEAQRRIGHLYPKVTLPQEYGCGEATVIAWLWARTVTCPNPACGAQMPLISSFYLSKKPGKETWLEPVVNNAISPPTVNFVVKTGAGSPPSTPKIGRGAQFKCLCCENTAKEQYIKSEGVAKRLGTQLIAIVAEGKQGRVYISPSLESETEARKAQPGWRPEQELADDKRNIWCVGYGLTTFADLFTPRQLVALNTFSDLIQETRERIFADARHTNFPNDEHPLHEEGLGSAAYADAVAVYLSMAVDRSADFWSSLAIWANQPKNELVAHTFTRQALPMVWDFAEANPFCKSGGNFEGNLTFVVKAVQLLPYNTTQGYALQQTATDLNKSSVSFLISTDPPYYDNIGYADLADFFYVWLRRSTHNIFPDLFKTVLVPKAVELIAAPYRFDGNKQKARVFFETGLRTVFEHLRGIQLSDYPLTIYYAFKQAEEDSIENEEGQANAQSLKVVASTGWETMLEGLIQSGFVITGTWPMRTERPTGVKGTVNALASSIVLVCRPRPTNAGIASRRQFLTALRNELPDALAKLQHGNIAPVDLAQASIGPGMAIYSRYSKVIEADGSPLRVRTALQLINSTLDELLAEQEGEYDAETRWAIAWFEQYAMEPGEYGVAETLSKAKNISIQVLVNSGWLEAKMGKVRLLKREELGSDWQPGQTERKTVWEVMQHMIYALTEQGEVRAAAILRATGEQGEMTRDLAYRLYSVCERKGWAQEALAYNGLVTSWSQISQLARREAPDQQLYQTSFL
ncbi:MAG TPA: DUF1156 domain-containing protein [Ktedonobacteraceae bacterium]|nr:DUF1156 domain-containing protein [Ktedonobacteraceae bacterium]